MTHQAIPDACHLLEEGTDALAAAVGPLTPDDELLSLLTVCAGVARRLDQLTVSAVAVLQRQGAFVARGYRSPVMALSDLLGWGGFEARRYVTASQQLCPQIGTDGSACPAQLPATADRFADGRISLRHADVIARVLDRPAAHRLAPQTWAGAEAELAEKATLYTPTELRGYGTALVNALDQDGEPPADDPERAVNELQLSRHGDRPGGTLTGRFDDAALYDAIAAAVDANSAPVGADDPRSTGQRQAEALADVCGHVLDHGPTSITPERGGRRPHLNVLIRLEDLQAQARAAMLDFGGEVSPRMLRLLACDAAVVPIVMGGDGQPLDVGRSARTIPDGLRRAIAARDRGCAYPGVCHEAPLTNVEVKDLHRCYVAP